VDAPRRWQVASSVTALAGLGLGAIALGRPTIEPVEPIRLEVGAREDPSAATEPAPEISFELPAREGLTIVPPIVVEDPPPTDAPAPRDPDSVDDPDSIDSDDSQDSDD
jgi:hypothetical protein